MKSDLADFTADSSETSPWTGNMELLGNLRRRGHPRVSFLKWLG
jgi:hypothetical protein